MLAVHFPPNLGRWDVGGSQLGGLRGAVLVPMHPLFIGWMLSPLFGMAGTVAAMLGP